MARHACVIEGRPLPDPDHGEVLELLPTAGVVPIVAEVHSDAPVGGVSGPGFPTASSVEVGGSLNGIEGTELMACVNDRFAVFHDDTAQSAALLVGADREAFDVAGVEGNAAVVQSSGYDGGERHEGLTVGEGHVHALPACSQSWDRKLDPNALRTNVSAASSCASLSSPGSAITTSTMDNSVARQGPPSRSATLRTPCDVDQCIDYLGQQTGSGDLVGSCVA